MDHLIVYFNLSLPFPGSPYGCYGRKSLTQALVSLHGFYRTGTVLCLCHDWQDWESMAVICNAEKQWPQVRVILYSMYMYLLKVGWCYVK